MISLPGQTIRLNTVTYTAGIGDDPWVMKAMRYRFTWAYLVERIMEISEISYSCTAKDGRQVAFVLTSISFEDWFLRIVFEDKVEVLTLSRLVYVTGKRRWDERNLRSSFNILHWHAHDLNEIHYHCLTQDGSCAVDVMIKADTTEDWSVHVTLRKLKPREKQARPADEIE